MSTKFGQLTSKERILRKLRDEFCKLRAGQFWLLLAQGRQRQHNLRKRPEIMAALGGDLELLDPCFLVAADSGKTEEESLGRRQAADDVVRSAQSEVSIGGVWRDYQQFLGVPISISDHFQAFHLLLIDQAGIVGLHTHAEGHGEQGVRIVRVRLQSELR